jgi:rod shape-determining protein MreD
MKVVLPALAALGAAVLELSVAPRFGVSGAHPHLVLVLGVIATVAIGGTTGLVWGFTGGAALDLLAVRPLGATAFVLLIVLAGAGLVGRPPPRLRPMAAIGLVPVCSALSSILLVVVLRALATPAVVPDAVSLLPAIAYDTAIAAVVAPVAVLLARRTVAAGYAHG